VALVAKAAQLGKGMRQAVRCHALRHGRNHQQVAIARKVFEIVVGRVAFRVDDDVLIVADVAYHLRVGDDLEGEALICASLSPLGRGADGVAVNEQGRGEALQIGGQVNGRRGFADAAFVACDRDYHLSVYAKW